MTLLHDFLLVEEIAQDDLIEGTNLRKLHDELSPFMHVQIVDVSSELIHEYLKYYPRMTTSAAHFIINTFYKKGTKLLINRIAKKTTEDGYYIISFKDVLAIEEDVSIPEDVKTVTNEDLLIRG